MVVVVVAVKVKRESVASFLEIFKANVPHVLAEEGCIEYFPAVDLPTGMGPQSLDPAVVTIIEKWASLDALKTHLAAPHMQTYRQTTKGMVESMELKVLQPA